MLTFGWKFGKTFFGAFLRICEGVFFINGENGFIKCLTLIWNQKFAEITEICETSFSHYFERIVAVSQAGIWYNWMSNLPVSFSSFSIEHCKSYRLWSAIQKPSESVVKFAHPKLAEFTTILFLFFTQLHGIAKCGHILFCNLSIPSPKKMRTFQLAWCKTI